MFLYCGYSLQPQEAQVLSISNQAAKVFCKPCSFKPSVDLWDTHKVSSGFGRHDALATVIFDTDSKCSDYMQQCLHQGATQQHWLYRESSLDQT